MTEPVQRLVPQDTRPLHEPTVAEAREIERVDAAGRPPRRDVSVADRSIRPARGPAIGLRVFTPPPARRRRGLLVYLHGGGWAVGGLHSGAELCADLAARVGCRVASVAYRLAPEHPFPAGVEDAWAATQWVAAHPERLGAEGGRLAIAGTSAGANLAAAVALLARDQGGPRLRLQVLISPPISSAAIDPDRDPARGRAFDARSVAWCWHHYLAGAGDGQNPLASPLLAVDLAGLPPAVVVTAEYEPVRDQAERYAERMAAAGVHVDARRVAGMEHGFVGRAELAEARHARRLIAARLRRAFAGADNPVSGA